MNAKPEYVGEIRLEEKCVQKSDGSTGRVGKNMLGW